MDWQPIATGDVAVKLRRSVDDIARALASAMKKDDPFGAGNLSGGTAGVGLFFANFADLTGDSAMVDLAERCFDHAALELTEHQLPIALYQGIAGIPAAMDCAYAIAGTEDADEQLDDEDDELDATILESVARSPWPGDYELISGLAGVGVYGLLCPRRLGRAITESVVDRLSESVDVDEDGARWRTPPHLLPTWQRERAPDGYYNFGAAHGMPGALYVLARASRRGIRADRALELFGQGARWMLSKLMPDSNRCLFPAWIPVAGEAEPARFGWCYGDPGVSAALAAAATAVGDDETLARCIEIASRAAQCTPSSMAAKDPALCHGTSGYAHIFNRFFQYTHDVSFKTSALTWLQDSLDKRRPGGVAGYWSSETVDGVKGGEPLAFSGLLSGAAGIGLAYIAALADKPPLWDRLLLLDIDG